MPACPSMSTDRAVFITTRCQIDSIEFEKSLESHVCMYVRMYVIINEDQVIFGNS